MIARVILSVYSLAFKKIEVIIAVSLAGSKSDRIFYHPLLLFPNILGE
ncbi:hypothetical protein VB774_08160 [Pseudanabaena galeata UHCC 0370]|uniref:Uncharacterized protein n=1 Tax=Pseudanabaena galeata UHCC 0370 TaxID=3110310 RepID=A0ABU5TH17_9CYAN|nr:MULTISPECIES: hypothetical protein [Pseudanabaena]MEA5477592.1 hypothetical protein [Pseudanabaena galeata UHCC 0370]MEA5486038.1 hypothetical protein [Pseudanabaena sp. CCNP1317]WGS73038.1 hypothetical protein OA858_03150 [Pseudanabaena galeata CCNP1313]